MITATDLDILCEQQMRDLIDLNIERKHEVVALDKSLCHSSLIAGQVKYLQRARTKLPSYYAARCIIPSRAFEQSSSEATASVKRICGGSVLDLTCGLGVDAQALAQRFDRVVTLERDEVLADVARENMRRLGRTNVEVVTSSAEEYLASCSEHFDWIYADPDRRSEDGHKRVLLEDCSPNMLALRADLERVADRVAIKCSPMFDVDEAFRLFGSGTSVEVVSVGDECKEIVIFTGCESEQIGATAVGRGEVWVEREGELMKSPQGFDIERYKYLLIPDVALQKGRIARRILSEVCDIWSDNGYGFASAEGIAKMEKNRHIARVEPIAWIGDFERRVVKRELASRGVARAEILKREYPHSIDRVVKQLGIKEGGAARVAVTRVVNRDIFIILGG